MVQRGIVVGLVCLAMLSLPTAVAGAEAVPPEWPPAGHVNYDDEWFGARLGQLWSYDAGSAVFASPVIAGGALYAGSDGGRCFALDLADGTPRWTYEAGGAIKDQPCLLGERVYFTTLAGDVIALAAADGALIWRTSLGERIDAGPLALADRVVVPCSDGTVRALAASDGREVWRYRVGLGARLLSTPAATADAVLIEADGGLTALDPCTGTELWHTALSGEFRHWPVVRGESVFSAGSGDAEGGVFALAAASGDVLARYTYGGDNHWSAPAVDARDDAVYAGLEGGVFCFDGRLNVRATWLGAPQSVVGRKRYVMWQPLILRDLVIVPGHLEIAAPDALFFFARDGRLSFLGRTELPEKLAAAPAVHDSVLYYGSVGGHVIALAPIRVSLNGRLVDFGLHQPLVQASGRVLVPARAVFEAAGGTVEWDGEARTVTVRLGGHAVQLVIDSATILIDGRPAVIDEPARLIDDATLVPIRAVIEGLGGQVAWDAQAQMVLITIADDR